MQNFQQLQHQFAAHIRNPESNAAPDAIEPRRMKIYTDLFYNNIEGFIGSGFPVLRAIYASLPQGDARWHTMVREFVDCHLSRSPYFPEIGREFLGWLQCERPPIDDDFAFMQELAHYEWVEVALDVAIENLDAVGCDPDGDLLRGHPVVSPLAWPLVYQYPVHKIGPDYLPDSPPEQPTCLVVYRDRKDEVKFLEANPVTIRLLEILQEGQSTGQRALGRIVEETRHPNPDTVVQGGRDTLEKLRALDIILGC
jgi:hypothetical protein